MAARGIPVDGGKLERARMARRLSAAQLAGMVGCSRAHIRLLERGERVPSIELLGLLEQALGVTAEELGADVPPRRHPIGPVPLLSSPMVSVVPVARVS